MDLKQVLEKKLTKKQIKELRTSFDIIGDIIVLDIPEVLEKKEEIIAKALVKIHPRVKTVCKKLGERTGRLRLRDIKILVGSETETIHKEYGCRFKLDVKRVYFSPRESTERQRIAAMVKPRERVLVMFSGIAPYSIIIAKKQPNCRVVGVDINKHAIKYAEENIRLNKVQDRVKNYYGDVREVYKKLGKFDRIIMPLPEHAYKYLDIAFSCCKKSGIIHLYGISEEKFMFKDLELKIKNESEKLGKKIKIINKTRVLPFGVRKWKIRIDIKIK